MANEKRLIDAAELDRKLEALAKKYYLHGRMEAAKDYSFVQTVLLSAPTVDAVEVVRCFECQKEGTEACPMVYKDGLTKCLCADTKGTDFCSYGERKGVGNGI